MLFQVIIALAINFSLKWKVLFIVNVLFTNEGLNVKKKIKTVKHCYITLLIQANFSSINKNTLFVVEYQTYI